MPDVFTIEKRSAVMSRIRSRGNKRTEQRIMALMRANGIFGWRRKRNCSASQTSSFLSQRVALFVDGCFWHRHPGCKFSYTPKIANRLLAAEVRTKCRAGSISDADSPQSWLAGCANLGVSACREKSGSRADKASLGVGKFLSFDISDAPVLRNGEEWN